MAQFKHNPTTWFEAREVWAKHNRGPLDRVTLGNNTWLERIGRLSADDTYAIRLHDTHVVVFYADGGYGLNSGGYVTVTTADRMNAFTPRSLKVRRSKGEFFVRTADNGDSEEAFTYGWAGDA